MLVDVVDDERIRLGYIACKVARILLEVGTLKIDQFGRVDSCYGMLIKMFYSRAPEQMA